MCEILKYYQLISFIHLQIDKLNEILTSYYELVRLKIIKVHDIPKAYH